MRYDGYVFPCEAFKDGMMEIEEGVIVENVKYKRLNDIYVSSHYLRCVREGLESYAGGEDDENCYGQYLRKRL